MKIQTFTIVAGTAACNAKCPFCISKMTPKQGINYILPKVNWLNFRKACRLAQINNVSTVLLTGKGEPLLYPDQITGFLEKMQEFDFPIIEVQTNALAIGKDYQNYELYLKKWRLLGLNTIAISIVSYEKEKNKSVYTPDSDYIGLEEVIDKLHQLGFSIRLACIMLKGYVDSVEEVTKLAEFAKKNRVEQLTFRGVAVPNKSEAQDVYDYTLSKILTKGTLLDISEFMNKKGIKLMTLDHGGIVYDYRGQNICMTDCLTIKPEGEDLRQLIFFPDGHVRYDWQHPGAILI